jgi:ABC-type amino acid transport substrate-binding protein
MANTTFGSQMDSDSRLTRYRADSYDQMVTMFMHNRAKVITGNLAILLFQLKEQGGERLIDSSALQFEETANHLYLSKKSSNLEKIDTIINALSDMTKNGIVDKILVKYEGNAWKSLELHPNR